jgi:phosphoglycolate phosphatase-like HAD superfamily hydrolase
VAAARALAVDLDAALGDTHPLWEAWLADVSRRFGSIAPLDPEDLPRDRARAAEELDRWARNGVGDWRGALERFAEDHAPVYLRRHADVSAALRRLAAAGIAVGAFTDAPAELARVAVSQLGVARRLVIVEAGDGALARLRSRLGDGAAVVSSRDQLIRSAA